MANDGLQPPIAWRRNDSRRIPANTVRLSRSRIAITADIGDLMNPDTNYSPTSLASIFVRLAMRPTTGEIKLIPSDVNDKDAYIFTKSITQSNEYKSTYALAKSVGALMPRGDYGEVGDGWFKLRVAMPSTEQENKIYSSGYVHGALDEANEIFESLLHERLCDEARATIHNVLSERLAVHKDRTKEVQP